MDLNNSIAELPFPLPSILDTRDVLKKVLDISLGHENRRNLNDTLLGTMLFEAGMVPMNIVKFISEILYKIEHTLLYTFSIKLHYSTNYCVFLPPDTLVVYEEAEKPKQVFVKQSVLSDRDKRIRQEIEMELEKEEAYANY